MKNFLADFQQLNLNHKKYIIVDENMTILQITYYMIMQKIS